MGMPSIDIVFTVAAQTAIARSEKGVVAVIIKDAANNGPLGAMTTKLQIPEGLTAANQGYLQRAFLGYVKPTQKVIGYVLPEEAENLTEALDWLATQQFDYLAGPPEITPEECSAVKDWIVTQREENHAIFKAVLPNTEADHEAIINFTTDGIKVGEDTFDAAAYCSRMAGMLAGTPMTYSCTYAPLTEVEDVTRLTQWDADAAVDAGKFLLFYDDMVKTGRAVNSLTTIVGKSKAYQKIKIIEIMDMIQSDLRRAFRDNYIGKYANSYDNKMLLRTAVTNYFTTLARDELIQPGFTVGIDVEAQTAWLDQNGVDTSNMTTEQIEQANTGSEVFLYAAIQILDSIEDIKVTITV